MAAWHWPQYVFAAMLVGALLMDAHQHGRPRTVTENIWVSFVAVAVNIAILHFGGFW